MAFRLRAQESVSHGLQRLAKKELRAADDELQRQSPPNDEAIHEARKSIKKVRATLKLIEADGVRHRKSRKRLRTVNRTLSGLRDADAMIGILGELRKKNPRLLSEHTFARIRRQLQSHKRAAIESAERDGAWKRTHKQLGKLRKAARRWRTTHRGAGALAPGIELSHRRGRKAMVRARRHHRAADFHEWRKAIKTLWYQLRLVEACSPKIRLDVGALHRAQTWLGDDHNVVVLCEELSKNASLCGGPADLARLRVAAEQLQRDARKKAVASIKRIYARPTRDYLRHVTRAWNKSLKRGKRRNASARRRAAA